MEALTFYAIWGFFDWKDKRDFRQRGWLWNKLIMEQQLETKQGMALFCCCRMDHGTKISLQILVWSFGLKTAQLSNCKPNWMAKLFCTFNFFIFFFLPSLYRFKVQNLQGHIGTWMFLWVSNFRTLFFFFICFF